MAEKKEASEKEIKEQFTRDLKTAKQYMEPIHQKMDKFYEIYRNRWSDDACDFQISDLYAYTETVVPILTNNRVRGFVKSDYPDYVTHAKGMTDILDHIYDINNWDYKSQDIARMAEIYRSSMAYTGWDTTYKNGTGKVCVKPVNIRWCYLDPAPVEFDDSSFFFYVEPKRKTEVIKMYPKKKTEIEERIGKTRDDEQGKVGTWFRSWVNKMKQAVTFNSNTEMNRFELQATLTEMSEEEKRKNSVAFIHYWYRDDNDEWRVSYWADDILLEDMENPNWHGKLPYDIYNPTKDILSSMGIPMGEHIENLNMEKNLVMQYIIDNAKLHADPPLLQNTAFGNIQDPQALSEKKNGRGPILVNNPDMMPLNTIAAYMDVPTMPAYAIQIPDQFNAIIDRQTGTNDAFRGLSEATSGKEVQLKQEAAYTRIKTKVDNFELFNKNIAEKVIVLAMQHYKSNRAFRIKGDYSKYAGQDGQVAADLPFDVQPVQKGMNPDGQPVFDKSEFYMFANPNEWTKHANQPTEAPQMPVDGMEQPAEQPEAEATEESVQEAFKVLQFTVEIEAGSSLPTSRLARREEAMELAAAGFIDQEAILEAYDWPDRESVVKRMQEAAQAQQQAQMEMEQTKATQQMEMKRMELEARAQETQANNDVKKEVAAAKGQPEQPQQPQQPDIASMLDKIRQAVPELAELSDEELMAHIAQNVQIGA